MYYSGLIRDPEQEWKDHMAALDAKFGNCIDGKPHRWRWVEDFEGDSSIPRGTHDMSEYVCSRCELAESSEGSGTSGDEEEGD